MSESRHSDADRLERRARWLLRAYPAAYRADRGEEITGTLLEATPPGRDWPPPWETARLSGPPAGGTCPSSSGSMSGFSTSSEAWR